MNTVQRLATSSALGLVAFGAMLFIPAGTFDYWQAWVFTAVFTVTTLVPSIYLARTNPAALQRRMHAGPTAETRAIQKFIMVGAFVGFFGTVVISALDHRFGWSSVPAVVAVAGDVLVATGLGTAMLVVVQNSYAAATVTVEADQPVVSTGLYSVVRHPMYAGNIVLMVGVPLALGSFWGLLLIVPNTLVMVLRILDEERVLDAQLPGYRDYTRLVRYRLVPHLW